MLPLIWVRTSIIDLVASKNRVFSRKATFMKPAMQLLSQWEIAYATDLTVKISSVMAVCGNVAAAAYITHKICLSFGCSESRNHGAIGRDRLIIGIPFPVAKAMLAVVDPQPTNRRRKRDGG